MFTELYKNVYKCYPGTDICRVILPYAVFIAQIRGRVGLAGVLQAVLLSSGVSNQDVMITRSMPGTRSTVIFTTLWLIDISITLIINLNMNEFNHRHRHKLYC